MDGAERLLREVIAGRRDALGDLDSDVAVAIDDLTDVFRDSQSAPQAERLYGEVLQILLSHIEDPDASLSPLLRSLRRIDRTHAELVPDRQGSLARGAAQRLRAGSSLNVERVARLMFQLKEWAVAASLFEEAVAAAAVQTGEWSEAMVGLAASLVQVGDLTRAEGVCNDFIAAVRAGWAAPPRDYSAMLHVKSQVQEITLGAGAAIPVMRESVAQSERESVSTYGVEGADGSWAEGLLRLAELSLAAGDVDAAAESAGRVLGGVGASGGALTVARTRAVLANVARLEGRLVEAESLFRAALPPMLAQGPSWRTASALRDFGLLHTGAGNVDSGAPLIQRAVEMSHELCGKRSWQYATMLATLAEVRSGLGPVVEAAPLFVEVADIAEELDVPQLEARALAGCGALYTRIGASDAAEGLLNRALGLMTRHQAPAGDIAGVETDLAMTEARLGHPDAALDRVQRTILALRDGALGGPRLTNAMNTRMWILGRMARWGEAFATAIDLADLLEGQLRKPLTIASSVGRDRFAAALYQHLDVMLSLTMHLGTPVAIAEVFDRTLRWKGAALTWSAGHVHALAESEAVEVKSLRDDFVRVRSDIIRRTIGGAARADPGEATIDELRRREESLDREIARHLASSAAALGTADEAKVGWRAVMAGLPDEGALLEYVRYESIDFDRGGPGDRIHGGAHRYAAFVLRPGFDPELHDIGEADVVDNSISRFREKLTNEAAPRLGRDFGGMPSQVNPDDGGDPTSGGGARNGHPDSPGSAGEDLRRLVFDPMLKAITACSRLHIAQHGEITRLPFAALPIGDYYLLDHYELAFLDSGRDLLEGSHRMTAPTPPLVIADPDFDLDLPSALAGGRRQPFRPLAGTREEGEAVAALLGVVPRMGADAVESLVRTAGAPRILHIATHGFFLEDDRPPLPTNLVSQISLIQIPGHGTYAAQAFEQPRDVDDGPIADRLTRIGRLPDPLMRSGVALAGCNTWASGGTMSSGDAGLMTAAEIALLDLTSTDLAVLSACDTGLGEVRRGEGVFGLRRAFRIAGVSTLLMSLWKIPDAETRDLMIEFYRRASAGESFPQALRAAQLHVRQGSPQPLAWAGLQCIGR